MKKTTVTCDICNKECTHWYEIFFIINSAQNDIADMSDMLNIDGVLCGMEPKYLCRDCATTLVKAAKRMRKYSQLCGGREFLWTD